MEVQGINEAQAKIEALKAAVKAEKEAAKTRAWESRYSHVVPNSTRESMEISSKKHGHGKVCTIRCEMCSKERTINVQDAFQVRWCFSCAEVAKKGRQQAKRAAKAAAKQTPEALAAKIAELTAMLATLEGKEETETATEEAVTDAA